MPDKLKLTAEENVFVALALAHLADNWPSILDNWPGILREQGKSPHNAAKLRKLAAQFLRAKQVSITFWPKALRSKQTEAEIIVLATRRRARGKQDRE